MLSGECVLRALSCAVSQAEHMLQVPYAFVFCQQCLLSTSPNIMACQLNTRAYMYAHGLLKPFYPASGQKRGRDHWPLAAHVCAVEQATIGK